MWTVIAAIIQLLALVFQNWVKREDEKRAGWKEAAKSGDISRINGSIDRLRS